MNPNQIDLNALMTFHTVVENGSIQKAKDILARTQPAITLRLNKLEDDLGRKLFLQKKPSLKLSPEGMALYKWTAHLKKLMEKNPVARLGSLARLQYPLRIGTYTSISALAMAPSMSNTSRKFKDLVFSTSFSDPYDLFQKLRMGGLDIIVLPKHFNPSSDVRKVFSIPQKYFAIVPQSMKDVPLKNLKWCFYRNPKDIQLQALNDVLLENVPQPDIRWEISKLTSISPAVETGLAAAVVPTYFLCREPHNSVIVPLSSATTKPIPLEGYIRTDAQNASNWQALEFFFSDMVKYMDDLEKKHGGTVHQS